jgi:glutaredoxin-like protein NrdH
MEITVWTKSNCVQCTQTKKELTKRGIDFVEKNLEENPEQMQAFIEAGYMSAPIVTTDVKTWSGFRIDKISSLTAYLMGEKNHG